MTILEPAKNIKVINEVDICVVGGSCTGVFAAVRAARLGASVAIIEKQNCFGGMATAAKVNFWHTLYNETNEKQIVSGLSQEILERLRARNALIDKQAEMKPHEYNAYSFNPEELKIELDDLILQHKITPYLHTMYAGVYMEDDKIKGVFIQNKDGRNAILAKVFIDASGDGDLTKDAGIPTYSFQNSQPPTLCMTLYQQELLDFSDILIRYEKHREEFGLHKDWGWFNNLPNLSNIRMHAALHVFGVNCAKADELTAAEMKARSDIRKWLDLMKKYSENAKSFEILSLAQSIGIRETNHFEGSYKITDDDILCGKNFDDAIGYGCYAGDVHLSNQPGVKMRYFDGAEKTILADGQSEMSTWKEKPGIEPTYYQLPLKAMFNNKVSNLLTAGRMIDAERYAFGALRVMINQNQFGEAAGVCAFLALYERCNVSNVESKKVREALKNGGSIIF